MGLDTIAVTGGNGKIGRETISELNDHGYRTVDLARGKRREERSDEYLTTDLTNPGEVYGSLAKSDADAIIHMGTIPSPTSHPGYVTFESNVMSTYHVLEAATELGLEAACIASSINALGVAFQEEPSEIEYLPVDEDHPLTPRDPYAIGKHALEVVCDGFGRMDDAPETIASLRYPWVATGEELASRYVEDDRSVDDIDPAGSGRDHLFSYLHVTDAASIARLAVEAEFTGHEVFWAVAGDTTLEEDSQTVADRIYPDLDRRAGFEGRESLISIEKARDVLGWEPSRSWTDYR